MGKGKLPKPEGPSFYTDMTSPYLEMEIKILVNVLEFIQRIKKLCKVQNNAVHGFIAKVFLKATSKQKKLKIFHTFTEKLTLI